MAPTLDQELLQDFLWTTREEVSALENTLVAMESGRRDRELINSVYRTFHSIKGAAGLVQAPLLERAAHACESLLAPVREQPETLSPEIINCLLSTLDGVKATLNHIEAHQCEDPNAFATSRAAPTPAPVTVSVSMPPPAPIQPRVQAIEPQAPAPAEWSRPAPVQTPAPAQTSAPVPAPAPAGEHKATDNEAAETAVRVDIQLLDRLMTQVGELVLARNRLLQVASTSEDPALTGTAQAIDQVTSALQEHIMRTRMQPLANIFNKFPRLVRDLAKQLGKQIELDITGKETELDRTLLEGLRDPFTHILRNACDHGVESPEARLAAGKAAVGRLMVRAHHEGGQVVVEVADDGKGIDPVRIKAKAVSMGVLTQAEAARMPDAETALLICHPGLSTAEAVTAISGRGVGMDVVKRNIERMGGSLEIQSTPGRGTTFRLKIPLTLAIIPALMVRVGGQLLGIPQLSLVELVGVDPSLDSGPRIEHVRGAEVFRLRDQLLTLVRLDQLLGQPRRQDDGTLFIVVVADGNTRFGLVVDEILDTEEIVVKPLSRHLAGVEVFAGATIRGDGRVALILDLAGVTRVAALDVRREQETTGPTAAQASNESGEFLVFHLGHNERFAVPLSLVERIERHAASALSEVNGTRVLCHDGHLTPAIELDRHTKAKAMVFGEEPIYAIVLSHRTHAAIIAAALVDNLTIDLTTILDQRELMGDEAVTGLAVVEGIPTALLDPFRILDRAFPPPTSQPSVASAVQVAAQPIQRLGASPMPAAPASPLPAGKTVLFCEDAQFFQNVVLGYLTEAGYAVDVCANGKEGLDKLLADPDRYGLVLTDLEMPVMDGWELIKSIRQYPAHDRLPLVALTSLSDEAARQRTLQFGADRYVVKLHRDELLRLVRETMGAATAAGA